MSAGAGGIDHAGNGVGGDEPGGGGQSGDEQADDEQAGGAHDSSAHDSGREPTVHALREEDVDAAVAFDGSFIAFQRLQLALRDGVLWCDLESFDTQQLDEPYRKNYGDDADAEGLRDYLQRARGNTAPDAAAFVVRVDGRIAGRMMMSRTWNGFAYLDDIAIDRNARRRGAGNALMRTAIAWAREHGYPGIMLETQDTNVIACRLYLKHGFELGGCDRFHYANEPDIAHETALFWYRML